MTKKQKIKTPYYQHIDAVPSHFSPEEQAWYKLFISAYYYRNKKAMDELGMPVLTRRELYNRHRGVCNDIYNKPMLDYGIIDDLVSEKEE